jgi:hypothetical protein
MTTHTFRILLFGTALVASAVANPVPVFIFGLVPSGNISGEPGQTIGWGYAISNEDPTDYLVLTNLDAATFLNGSASGLFDFPIIAPLQTVTETFDAGLSQGLYELTWNANAPDAFVNSGEFTVTADWYNGDPFGSGTPIEGLTGVTLSQPYSATVATPEPAAVLPVLACLAGIVLRRRRAAS